MSSSASSSKLPILDEYDFKLPKELIAQSPAHPRDQARLLVWDRATKQLTDDYFYNIDNYLPKGSTLVVNNSRVEKCRLRFGAVELFVTRTVNPTVVEAMVRPGKRFKAGSVMQLAPGLEAQVVHVLDDGQRRLRLSTPLSNSAYDQYRLTPLPPYIAQNETLAEEYQTVYADPPGSKAAPTAGLHFTTELLDKIKQQHQVVEVTLHVGLGTFAPLRASELASGHLHEETCQITSASAKLISEASHRTVVGTTTVRTLESAAQHTLPIKPGIFDTDIFIRPGFEFKLTDALITNFHLPRSSLLMLVAAFMGRDELMTLYEHAVREKYRFYSFGDAMLIL